MTLGVLVYCYYCGAKLESNTKVDKWECHGNVDWIRFTCDICGHFFLISEDTYDHLNK